MRCAPIRAAAVDYETNAPCDRPCWPNFGRQTRVLFGDQTAGSTRWKPKAATIVEEENREHDAARLTATPLATKARLRSAASWEETRSLDPNYPCCTFRAASWRCKSATASNYINPHVTDRPNRREPQEGTPQFGRPAPAYGPRRRSTQSAVAVYRHRRHYSTPAHPCRTDRGIQISTASGVGEADVSERRLQLVVRHG